MEDNTIAVVMVLVAIFLGAKSFNYWSKRQKTEWISALYMLDRAMKAADALNRWEQARPALNHGHCPYARHLVMQQITALEYLAEHGHKGGPEHFEYISLLYDLIEKQPPDYDPPLAGFIIEINWWYARIVGL